VKRNAYRILAGYPEGNSPLGKPRRRWNYDIKMDLTDTGWGNMGWLNLIWDMDKWQEFADTVICFGFYNILKIHGYLSDY
jgi:hypothetical protein